jgi:hypothetical protein
MSEASAPNTGEPKGTELLRAWIVGEELHCTLQPDVCDAATWGMVLAGLARHIAEGLQEQEGLDPADALAGIRTAFLEQTEPGAEDADA